MTTYSYGELETLWINAGGSKSLAPLMAAIALAESGGNPNANNYTDNGGLQTSWGLWQISDGTHNQPVPNIDDPNINAQQAVKKVQSQGLSAWGTYDSGAYRQFMNGNVAPSPVSGSTPVTNATQAFNPTDPNSWLDLLQNGTSGVGNDFAAGIASGMEGAFMAMLKPLLSYAWWTLEVVGGLFLVGFSFFLAMQQSQNIRNIEKAGVIASNPELAPAVEAGSVGQGAKVYVSRRATKKRSESREKLYHARVESRAQHRADIKRREKTS